MLPVGEQIIEESYQEYLKLPLSNCTNPSTEIYQNQWCIIIGLSIIAPHPRRHYTFEEFIEKALNDSEFQKRFIKI